ncbi:MAG TPA: twitching motility protein PilT [Bacteroidales bacterium]|nr:twitching motility protein PilT [Bacteroidales bacterium]
MPVEFKKFVTIRLYGNLNDFLPSSVKQKEQRVGFWGKPAVKDLIESLGVPHVEIFLILVDGLPVNFSFRPAEGSLISCYPKFSSISISSIALRPNFEVPPRFVLDVHLGRLAAYLRFCGFDTLYDKSYTDNNILDIALADGRVILTRDKGILRNGKALYGYFLRNTNPQLQLSEVVEYFDLAAYLEPFSRCSLCNGEVVQVEKSVVENQVPRTTFQIYNDFFQCSSCGQIYWEGPHFNRIAAMISGYSK